MCFSTDLVFSNRRVSVAPDNSCCGFVSTPRGNPRFLRAALHRSVDQQIPARWSSSTAEAVCFSCEILHQTVNECTNTSCPPMSGLRYNQGHCLANPYTGVLVLIFGTQIWIIFGRGEWTYHELSDKTMVFNPWYLVRHIWLKALFSHIIDEI